MSSSLQQCVETRRNGAFSSFRVSTALATQQPAAAGWALYPVPAAGRQLQLRTATATQLHSVQLIDLTGRACFTYPAAQLVQPTSLLHLDLPPLPAGIYTLRIQPAGEATSIQRVVLE